MKGGGAVEFRKIGNRKVPVLGMIPGEISNDNN